MFFFFHLLLLLHCYNSRTGKKIKIKIIVFSRYVWDHTVCFPVFRTHSRIKNKKNCSTESKACSLGILHLRYTVTFILYCRRLFNRPQQNTYWWNPCLCMSVILCVLNDLRDIPLLMSGCDFQSPKRLSKGTTHEIMNQAFISGHEINNCAPLA